MTRNKSYLKFHSGSNFETGGAVGTIETVYRSSCFQLGSCNCRGKATRDNCFHTRWRHVLARPLNLTRLIVA